MPTMFYVSGIGLLRGRTAFPTYRTDYGKFFTRADAERHMETLRGRSIHDMRIDEREDAEGDGHAHGFNLNDARSLRHLR